jgi:hypothetical protein
MKSSATNLALLFKAAGLPEPVPEYRFCEGRRWRFDYAFPEHKIALEIEGGVWVRGRHTRGKGFLGDMEKYNRAVILGWKLLRCTPEMVKSGEALRLVQEALLRTIRVL